MGFLSDFDAFHEQAIKATGGLSDFGGDDYHEGLRRLLADYDKHSRLGPIGRQMITGDIVGNLVGRLVEEQGFKSFPQYANAPVEKPLIIVSMPRTGTTVLHRLIGQDPGMQTLPLWLACTPMPRPPRETWESNPGYQQVAQLFDQWYQMSPGLKQIHPQGAAEPDECRFALNHSFCSTTLSATATVPDYAAWVVDADARYVYRRHRKVLALISGGSSQRWLLKDPTHMWHLPSLLAIFPDACVVMTHRDPTQAITSISSLVYQFRKLNEPDFTAEEMGHEFLGLWGKVLDKAEKARATIDPARIFDIHFDDVKADPIGSVQRIYRYFGIPVSDEALASWQRRVTSEPSGGHGAHQYTPQAFGLSPDEVNARIGAYHERYLSIEKSRRAQR